jgi:flagellin-like hook-associated protein FlgL
VSGWKSDNPPVTVAASGTSLDLDLNQNGTADMKISLARVLRADAVVAVNTAASGWRTTDPSATVAATGSNLALDLNGNGVTDLTVQLAALSKPDTRLATTSYLSSWFSAAHPEISVQPTGTSLGVNLGFDGAADLGLQLSSLLRGDAKIAVTTASSVWKTTDPVVDLNQPSVAGIMTADLNGDGNNDMQIDLPDAGPYGAAWLSIEKVQVATTGPFRTTDPSVSLKYNDQAKTLGLQLDGSSEASDITIDLSATWAVNHLSVSPLGNGDAIDLTVDGRHRWVKSDGSTPNAPGMELSMSEMQEAINVIRLNSKENSSDLSVLTVRNQFIDEMAAILKAGAENLTLADLNEEGSNLLLLQTRQNLGTTSLSLTSKAAQNVLKLF